MRHLLATTSALALGLFCAGEALAEAAAPALDEIVVTAERMR